ncbi:RHS repeat domain-containing protein [Clostridium estertheticum]|nr:RHS repeat-associated core domain-containing protein [Clostridium estertheticum]
METSIDGENNKVEYTYTLLGQIKDIVTPNSRKENKKAQSYKYDARGNITGITEGNGNQTSYMLDDWGRITQIVTPEGGTEKYTYDYAGNIITTTDANGGTITYSYNSLGQVSEIKDQEGNSEYFYYDEEGNLSKQLDRSENIVDRVYNIDKNIVSVKAYKNHKKTIEEISKDKKILNIIDQRYNYNEDGTLKNAYTGNMLYEYSFNDEGMLESKSASGKTLLNYAYDKNNNIKTIKDITGKSSIYNYDAANRVKGIKDNKENSIVNYDYFKNDYIKSINYGNGLKSNYSYDGDGNVESLVTVTSTGEVLVDYNYAYDLNGNRIEKVSSKHKNHYTYDSMNRLKDSGYDGRQESFTYDKVGNRLSKTTNGITDKYIYNVKNQLKELHQDSGTNLFTYDKQDNTIKEETQVGNNSYEYNNLNQQVKALTKEGNTLVSRYDTEGLRCEIEENEKLTKFIFHKENILVETDKDFNAISRFTRGYEVVTSDITSNTEKNRYYYTQDEQGSTVFVTDKDQEIKNEYCYDAFGNVLESTEDVHNRITYTGKQFDGITQQYYLRARFYNPVIGRFTQEDIYRGDGLNLYSYCGSNPVGYCDPSGYAKRECPPSKTQAINDTNETRTKVNAIQGDANYTGELPPKSWSITESGDGCHMIERVNVKNRADLAQFDTVDTPRFYPDTTFIDEVSANKSRGLAHQRLHVATKEAGIRLQGGNLNLTDAELLARYGKAYSNVELDGISGTLRTPDSSNILGINMSSSEAFNSLLEWGSEVDK